MSTYTQHDGISTSSDNGSILHFACSRLFTLIAGFGEETFSAADYFFWIPWIMPHIGGVIGALTYYFMIEHHHPDDD